MGRATRAFRSGRKPPMHAPSGVVEGGQFIGRSSITHAIIRALTRGERPLADPYEEVGALRTMSRRQLLDTARSRGISIRRGKPDPDVVAAIARPRRSTATPARRSSPPPASRVRERLLSMHTNQERREYLAGLGLTRAQSNRLARDLGARETRISADATLDNIVRHFDLPRDERDLSHVRGAGVFSTDPEIRRAAERYIDAHRPSTSHDPEQHARDRQADIDDARRYADVAGELDELIHHEATDRALVQRFDAAIARHGIGDDPELPAVRKALQFNRRQAAWELMGDLLRRRGVTPNGRAGDGDGHFDPSMHQPISGSLRQGQPIAVVRPGFTLERDGERVRIRRATVEAAHAATPPQPAAPRRTARQQLSGQRSTEQHVAVLEALQTRGEATAYVEGIRGRALTDLARHYHASHHRTVAERRSAIVYAAVGRRLDSDAIRRVDTTPGVLAQQPRVISNRELGETAMRLRVAHDMEQDEAILHARELLASRNPGATFELDAGDDGLDKLDTYDLVDLALEYEISNPRDLTHAQLLTALRARNARAPEVSRRRTATERITGRAPTTTPPASPASSVGQPSVDRVTGRRPSAGLRISLALQEWSNGDGSDEPLVGKFTRVQLRTEAVARGIRLRRAATDREIADALKAETREHFRGRQQGLGDLHTLGDLLAGLGSDAEVRAVFEGNFGGMTTRVERVSRGRPGERRLAVAGTVYDSNGREVGQFQRSYNYNTDGQLVAHHDLLAITSQVQGSGFSNAFNGHLIRWYRQSGAKQVRVHADIDVGGYAWARLGYDFADRRSADHILGLLDEELSRLERQHRRATRGGDVADEIRQARELLLRAGDRQFGEPGFPTPYEISQLGRWDGAGRMDRWIGKRILLGSDWYGVMRL